MPRPLPLIFIALAVGVAAMYAGGKICEGIVRLLA
jgi:hypothetical protein